MPSRPSAPLAALCAVLAALSVVVLAQPRDAARPLPPAEPPPPPAPVASPQRQRLLAEQPIDLNAASAEELELLPRIGPRLAARIVEDRAARGPFESVDALGRVRGIGPRTLERLRPLVTVAAPAP